MKAAATEAQLMEIYWATIHTLYAYVSRRCGGRREFAEDVTQETWLRAVREWRRRGIPDTPPAWLTAVARNILIDQARRHHEIAIDPAVAADVLAAVEQNDTGDATDAAAAVTQALARIPRKEAELIEAFHFEGRKVAQIAESYGVSERAVEGRLRRARERLRRELEITLKRAGGLA
jgi:RNA polymerase sigma-70 factor (ECF subfamily)